MAARGAAYALMMEAKPEAFALAKQTPSPAAMHRPSKRVIALVVFVGILAVIMVTLPFVIKRSEEPKRRTNATEEPQRGTNATEEPTQSPCTGDCTITLVESIPVNVKFPTGSIHNPSIYNGWMNLLKIAKKKIDIASFYWTLRGSDTNTSDPSTQEGDKVFDELQAVAKRGTLLQFIKSNYF